jgi:AraC-like DNA-binding protein
MAVSEPYIKGNVIFGLPEFIDQHGGDSAALLREAGLPVIDYSKPEVIVPFRKIGIFTEIAARSLNMPSLGIEYILKMPPHLPNLAPFIMLAKFEKDCRGWLKAVQKYLKVHTNGFALELFEEHEKEFAILRYNTDALTVFSRQMTESVLAKIVVAVRSVTREFSSKPLLVKFQHSATTADMSAFEKCFGCPIEFNASHTEIVFDKRVLAMSTQGNLTLLRSLMGVYVEYQISHMPKLQSTTTTMVSLAISGALGTGVCNIDHLASSFNMNPKKLQRTLTDEGTSFSEILDEVRKNLACKLLLESAIPITRIAGMLDYAGSPPFTLAFRRWTGNSPLEYRKRSKAA